MTEETITFDLIRKIQREEQRIPKLTKLPDSFYQNVQSYFEQKRKISSEKKGVLEVKNIERLVEDVFNRRERKILNQAVISTRTGIMPENLTDEEKEFFNQISETLKNRRNKHLNKLFSKETVTEEEMEKLLIFKEDVPEFIGSDMKTYGPFKKGDIAKLPDANMNVLIERGIVEEFKVKK
jgi:DNA replication factor GINS